MAMVPLLVIRIMVMMAISSSGMLTPPTCSANTSAVLGHGSTVDMRTFMYEVRKQVKMNVSLSRKIHIIALPHGTANACLSADQSLLAPRRPRSASGNTLMDSTLTAVILALAVSIRVHA